MLFAGEEIKIDLSLLKPGKAWRFYSVLPCKAHLLIIIKKRGWQITIERSWPETGNHIADTFSKLLVMLNSMH